MNPTSNNARILLVESSSQELSLLRAPLESGGHLFNVATEDADVLRAAAAAQIEVVLLDCELARANGFELLTEIVSTEGAPSVLVVAKSGDVATAVEAMRRGAEHFLELPLSSGELENALQSAFRNRTPEPAAMATEAPAGLIGHSPGMRRVLNQLDRAASASKVTTLILGESGTGKELVAKAIHALSDRAQAPFVALNCAALTEGLLEAELFGYEGGAFTGAAPKGRDGLFAAAEGGTLFLDEIGELALSLQAKLLRVLQEGAYRRVGSSQDVQTNVRILSSTNRDLESCASQGSFREDLYYRIGVVTLRCPPLRERGADIRKLASTFVAPKKFTDGALEKLDAYPWPGNVRELRNTIERSALMLESGRIQPKHLGLARQIEPALPSEVEDLSLSAMEKEHIRRVIRETAGNRSQAARLLGVNRTTLYNKLKRHGLSASAS